MAGIFAQLDQLRGAAQFNFVMHGLAHENDMKDTGKKKRHETGSSEEAALEDQTGIRLPLGDVHSKSQNTRLRNNELVAQTPPRTLTNKRCRRSTKTDNRNYAARGGKTIRANDNRRRKHNSAHRKVEHETQKATHSQDERIVTDIGVKTVIKTTTRNSASAC